MDIVGTYINGEEKEGESYLCSRLSVALLSGRNIQLKSYRVVEVMYLHGISPKCDEEVERFSKNPAAERAELKIRF